MKDVPEIKFISSEDWDAKAMESIAGIDEVMSSADPQKIEFVIDAAKTFGADCIEGIVVDNKTRRLIVGGDEVTALIKGVVTGVLPETSFMHVCIVETDDPDLATSKLTIEPNVISDTITRHLETVDENYKLFYMWVTNHLFLTTFSNSGLGKLKINFDRAGLCFRESLRDDMSRSLKRGKPFPKVSKEEYEFGDIILKESNRIYDALVPFVYVANIPFTEAVLTVWSEFRHNNPTVDINSVIDNIVVPHEVELIRSYMADKTCCKFISKFTGLLQQVKTT